jgi:hypothetical protein
MTRLLFLLPVKVFGTIFYAMLYTLLFYILILYLTDGFYL